MAGLDDEKLLADLEERLALSDSELGEQAKAVFLSLPAATLGRLIRMSMAQQVTPEDRRAAHDDCQLSLKIIAMLPQEPS